MESQIITIKTEVEEAEEEELSTNWINTDYSCFLCLWDSDVVKPTSLRSLLRHLQINQQEVCKDGNHWPVRNGEWDDIEVDLCMSCTATHSRLHTLLEQLEKVQMEVNYLLEETNKNISESGGNLELTESFFAKLSNNPRTPFNSDFVDNLRKKIAMKCKRMQIGRQPKIILECVESGNREAVIGIGAESSEDEDSSSQMEMAPISDAEEDTSAHDSSLLLSSEPRNSFRRSKQEALPEKGNPSAMPSGQKSRDAIASTSKRQETQPCERKTMKSSSIRRRKSQYFTKNSVTGLFQCKKCDKQSPHPQTIYLHYQSSHLKIRHQCDICKVADFAHRPALAYHRLTCQRNLEKRLAREKDPKFKFVCKICGKRFDSQTKVYKHRLQVHENVDRYPCDLCDKKFKTPFMLKEHKDGVHFGKKISCRFCKKLYGAGSRSRLRKHEKSCMLKNVKGLTKHA